MEPIVAIADLSKAYRNNRGVRNITLELRRGDVYGLLGPNGAGKTTLLKLMTGLIRPDSGSIALFGRSIGESFESAMNKVGCMIESADFYEYTNAVDYLKLVARFYPNLRREAIMQTLEQVGLSPYAHEKIKFFSTGMKQKLALAAAVLPDPELVLLDEPTNGLDIEGIVLFREMVRRLSSERGITFLISSHMIHELEQLCNRIGIVFGGELVQEGEVADLLRDGSTLEQFYIRQLARSKEAISDGQLTSGNPQ
ncbi:ABC transporter ATP-binding protein [Cohnella endophytica]|uniref:ABC transporter ATP-binding protein n=1 Tax=Cohnella endophytica TaxID=2419778 RepID=A0A494Y3S3_9BACL|nr:ABC transporter ATP-binding protein [Cohnella endophytica]RKP56941.1 ABC transporter ATP-binding protein [Cohnella endophytica]